MSPLFAFILGLLIGWLVEWLIDWFYWRKKYKRLAENELINQDRIAELEEEIEQLKKSSASAAKPLPAVSVIEKNVPSLDIKPEPAAVKPAAAPVPDDLKLIKGIGPVIEGKLNAAGIFTFAQLGALTAADLRQMLGKAIERLADEDSLLEQARQMAQKK